jgi:hypothetical protein
MTEVECDHSAVYRRPTASGAGYRLTIYMGPVRVPYLAEHITRCWRPLGPHVFEQQQQNIDKGRSGQTATILFEYGLSESSNFLVGKTAPATISIFHFHAHTVTQLPLTVNAVANSSVCATRCSNSEILRPPIPKPWFVVLGVLHGNVIG